MKVFITGGSGFIGSHLTNRLLNENHHVVVIDNYETGRRDNLEHHENLEIIEGTISNRELLFSIFEKNNFDLVSIKNDLAKIARAICFKKQNN
jgi:UDP-glucose 4-epimerase